CPGDEPGAAGIIQRNCGDSDARDSPRLHEPRAARSENKPSEDQIARFCDAARAARRERSKRSAGEFAVWKICFDGKGGSISRKRAGSISDGTGEKAARGRLEVGMLCAAD